MSSNSSIRGLVAKAKKDRIPKAGQPPMGRNPVVPLQRLDPRIPLSTGMVPVGYADDMRVVQGLKKDTGTQFAQTIPKLGPWSKGSSRKGEVKR